MSPALQRRRDIDVIVVQRIVPRPDEGPQMVATSGATNPFARPFTCQTWLPLITSTVACG